MLYGLESAQLIPSVADRMGTLQLTVFRIILRLNTISIDRGSIAFKMLDQTNQAMEEEGNGRKKDRGVLLVEAYNTLQRNIVCRISGEPNSLIHNITFNGIRFRSWVHNGRRVGRPSMNGQEKLSTNSGATLRRM